VTHTTRWQQFVPRILGAGLLIATGAIHLDLYLTGYRTIPTIGWLFLLQVIAAFGLGALVLATANAVVSAMGAGFSLATLAGYLLSLRVGLFGFREVRTTAGIVAGIIEVVAFAALAALALSRPGRLHDLLAAILPAARVGALALTVAAAALLGAFVATGGPSQASTGTGTGTGTANAVLSTTTIHGVAVVTDAQGLTLYWFVPDTSHKSVCYGTCAAYWPPVLGQAVAGQGVTGRLGTITRTGGITQATYDGHPLYTYVGDSAPGQANGNNINLNGGLWHEMTVSG
jgi:predicted lipoprotein with Yx(FWY)xxD motif